MIKQARDKFLFFESHNLQRDQLLSRTLAKIVNSSTIGTGEAF